MLFYIHSYSKIICNFLEPRGYFDPLSAQKILNKGIWGRFITLCFNFCYLKKADFLDLWGHKLKPAWSEERVGERSMSTLNNILDQFSW